MNGNTHKSTLETILAEQERQARSRHAQLMGLGAFCANMVTFILMALYMGPQESVHPVFIVTVFVLVSAASGLAVHISHRPR